VSEEPAQVGPSARPPARAAVQSRVGPCTSGHGRLRVFQLAVDQLRGPYPRGGGARTQGCGSHSFMTCRQRPCLTFSAGCRLDHFKVRAHPRLWSGAVHSARSARLPRTSPSSPLSRAAVGCQLSEAAAKRTSVACSEVRGSSERKHRRREGSWPRSRWIRQ